MSFAGILLAAFSAWVVSELMSRQSTDLVVTIAAFTVGVLGSFALALAIMIAFEFIDEVPTWDASLIWAGDGTIVGSVAGALTGALNGRRVAKRLGR